MPNISRSKGNQTMKFSQSIEYKERILFFEYHTENKAGRLKKGKRFPYFCALMPFSVTFWPCLKQIAHPYVYNLENALFLFWNVLNKQWFSDLRVSKDVVNFFVSIGARAKGQLSLAKIKKITFSGKKNDAIRAKTNHMNFICT